jgi:hypothetical protein
MHFRGGAMAFTYMSTMLMELVDQEKEKVKLDDRFGKFLPNLPERDAKISSLASFVRC